MATVSVSPETFSLVQFDAGLIVDITARLIADIGLPDDLSVTVEVDETTPLGKAVVTSIDPVVISLESGALEDPKRPRKLSESGSADVLGRLLYRVYDRLDPDFGDPPGDEDLKLPHSVAWDAYAVGRLVRRGHRHYDNRQRRLYHFRNRHGFSDAADVAFARLWEGEGLTWADITAISDGITAPASAAST